MSSQKNRTPRHGVGVSLRQRLLGLGAVGGALAGVVAVVAMSGAVGGAVLLTNTASTSAAQTAVAPAAAAAAAPAKAAPVRTTMSASKSVMIENYAFSPSALTVSVGDTVTWTNMDSAPHTVTVSSGPVKFASPTLQKGQTFSYTFTKAGTYSYYCAVHPDMKAKVTVTGSSPSPTPSTPTPSTGGSGHGGMTSDACGGAQASLDAFLAHLYAGHLETSVGQQVQDASNVNEYVKTHTVLIENMLKPLVGGGQASLDAFLTHLYAGHLETSVGQQVQDASNVNEYVKTHTVLIENMLKPLIGGSTAC